MKIQKRILEILKNTHHKDFSTATLKELYNATGTALVDSVWDRWRKRPKEKKRAAYLSAEFLTGRMIYMNLLNCGELENVKELFEENGRDISEFEAVEDAALGNGGLGRLAACFLDSAATQGVPLDGYGIRYKYGIFKQKIENGEQVEYPDDWTKLGDPFGIKNEEDSVWVQLGRQKVKAVPYDSPVIGYGARTVNNLRLWEAQAENEFDFSLFNAQLYDRALSEKNNAENISRTLYPNDSSDKGKKLRLKQEYFFSSASIQDMLRSLKRRGISIERFAEFYSVQLNDTHPAVAIPELIRLLMNDGVSFDYALYVARGAFAYTNHTVMPEALEKFEVRLFRSVLPHVYPTVVKIHNALMKELREKKVPESEFGRYAIIDGDTIHMARMSIFASHSVNGVAEIHTDILKTSALKEWNTLYPERFNNKTNGITQRRWLLLSNPQLSEFISTRIGDRWITNLEELEKLKRYEDDPDTIEAFRKIKDFKKKELAQAVQKQQGIVIDPDFIFDVQVKRIHEYKRQLLNALSILDTYNRLKKGQLNDFTPTAYLIGGKSAPGYQRAKGIIKLIHEIGEKVNNDPATASQMKVVFLENYNVSYAEKIIPAANISQQISTAGTEASGTGNMKFMLNGAVTLGTMDGANVEIVREAGEENNYIFGLRVEEVGKMRRDYEPMKLYEENERIRHTLDALIDGTLSDGGSGAFKDIYDSLLAGSIWQKADSYFLLADFISYCDIRDRVNRDYRDREAFFKKCFLNTASAGIFSSDRTILEYSRGIWKV